MFARHNPRIHDVVHARSGLARVTRCGLRYVPSGGYVLGDCGDPVARYVDAQVDCMACIAGKEYPHE